MNAIKKLFVNLTGTKVLKGLACILSGFYLTAYMDLYILDSIWSRLLMFGCFIVVCGFFLHAVSRLPEFAPSLKTILLAIVAAVLILVSCRDVFIPSVQETFITLIAENAGEICLCDVVVDGENIPVAQVEIVENTGWLYREEYDNFMIWPEEDGGENRLTMRFIAKEVHLGFPFTPYAGSVTIVSSVGEKGTWNLRCSERAEGEPVEYADFFMDCQRIYSPLEILMYSAGSLLIICFFCLIVLCAVGFTWRKWGGWTRLFQFLELERNLTIQKT